MSIPRPGKELVGKNVRIVDGQYNDDYLTALNQFASVDKTFGRYRADIAKGGNSVGRVIMGTLGKNEWENHLVALVMGAAKAGEWKAVVREPYVHTSGLDAVEGKKFGYVVKHEKKTFLLPTALYLDYCKRELASS